MIKDRLFSNKHQLGKIYMVHHHLGSIDLDKIKEEGTIQTLPAIQPVSAKAIEL